MSKYNELKSKQKLNLQISFVYNDKVLPEADVVEGLVVDAIGLVGVLNQLVNGQGRVVRLNNCVRHLKGQKIYR